MPKNAGLSILCILVGVIGLKLSFMTGSWSLGTISCISIGTGITVLEKQR